MPPSTPATPATAADVIGRRFSRVLIKRVTDDPRGEFGIEEAYLERDDGALLWLLGGGDDIDLGDEDEGPEIVPAAEVEGAQPWDALADFEVADVRQVAKLPSWVVVLADGRWLVYDCDGLWYTPELNPAPAPEGRSLFG